MTELSIREMQHADVDLVWSIEKQANRFPWSRGNFEDCLRTGYRTFLYSLNNELIGYCVVQSILDEIHLLNICVSPAHQGKGLGRQILSHVIDTSLQQAMTMILLEVRASNVRAQQLYFSAGFNEISVRKGYYPAEHGREDALLMGLELGMSEPEQYLL